MTSTRWMTRGCCLVAACALAASLSVSAAEDAPNNEFAVPVRVLPDRDRDKADSERDVRAERRAEESLALARRSADATDMTLYLNVAQIGVGFFGILGLAFTVYYARKAWVAANDAADAARKTLYSERAWLLPDLRALRETRIDGGSWNNKPFTGVMFEIGITNFGKTPAFDIEFWSFQEVFFDDEQEPGRTGFHGRRTHHGMVAPDNTPCYTGVNISDELTAELVNKTARLFLNVKVQYRDMFSETPRETIATYEVYVTGVVHKGTQPVVSFITQPVRGKTSAT